MILMFSLARKRLVRYVQDSSRYVVFFPKYVVFSTATWPLLQSIHYSSCDSFLYEKLDGLVRPRSQEAA